MTGGIRVVSDGWSKVYEFLDRRSDAFLYIVVFLLAVGAFFAAMCLTDTDRRFRRVAADLQNRTTPPGGQVMETSDSSTELTSWTLQFTMSWESYHSWLSRQLRGRYVVTRPTHEMIVASGYRFRDRYGLRIELLDHHDSTIRARAVLNVSPRQPAAREVAPD